MSEGTYIDPHPRDKQCNFHTEDIAIICQPGPICFGERPKDVIDRVCKEIEGYGESIDSREHDRFEEFELSCPTRGTEQEASLHAQKLLLTHSLWLIDHETILEDSSWASLSYQCRNLPDQTNVYTWVEKDNPDRDSIVRDIRSQLDISVATSLTELENNIKGYLGFQVNPDGAEANVVEWSHKVAEKIDKLD